MKCNRSRAQTKPPPDHTLNHGIAIKFNKKKLSLTKSKNGKEKSNGLLALGSILSQRAINAYERHGSPVLILTFNITLKNYIRDKINDIHGRRDFSSLEISNYHQFYHSQVNNTEEDIIELINRYGMQKLYSENIFQNNDGTKYQAILIDKIQGYQSEWVKILRDNFLGESGEMILFGDES